MLCAKTFNKINSINDDVVVIHYAKKSLYNTTI